jgi:hypothetical protein
MTLEQQARAFSRNRTAVVGSGAGVVLVFLGWRQLRAQQAPIVLAAPAAGATDTGATSLSAFQAGASAASSGFDTGAALGQGALGLAGNVVGYLGDATSTLAGSQADLGGSLADALSSLMGYLTTPGATLPVPPSPTPLPGTTPTPAPTPTPTPTQWWPSSLGTPPASAVGYIVVASANLNTYSVSGTRATVNGTISGGFTAYADRLLGVTLSTGGTTTLVHLVSGRNAGRWIGKSRGTWHPKH